MFEFALVGIGGGPPPSISLSAPHDDVTGAGNYGNVVTYNAPSARNVSVRSEGGSGALTGSYKKNGGSATAWGGIPLSLAVAAGATDTYQWGIDAGSDPGARTVVITDADTGVELDRFTLTT